MPPGQLDQSEPLTHLFQGANCGAPKAHECHAVVAFDPSRSDAKRHQVKHIRKAQPAGKRQVIEAHELSVLLLCLRRRDALGLLNYNFNFEGR